VTASAAAYPISRVAGSYRLPSAINTPGGAVVATDASHDTAWSGDASPHPVPACTFAGSGNEIVLVPDYGGGIGAGNRCGRARDARR
jgi:hypothetical protein